MEKTTQTEASETPLERFDREEGLDQESAASWRKRWEAEQADPAGLSPDDRREWEWRARGQAEARRAAGIKAAHATETEVIARARNEEEEPDTSNDNEGEEIYDSRNDI